MAGRAATPELGDEILAAMAKSRRYYGTMDHGSFGGGNISGGLSTIEEKSIGAYAKSGTRPIVGLLKPGVRPERPGLYLMDMVTDGPVRWGYPNINDTTEVAEMVASGAHVILFSTGCGSVVGLGGRAGDQGRAPIPRPTAGWPATWTSMPAASLEGRGTLDEVGARDRRRGRGGGPRRADQVRGARPPGIRARLQAFRTARAGLLPRLGAARPTSQQGGAQQCPDRLAACCWVPSPARPCSSASAAAQAADKVTLAHQLDVLRLARDLPARHGQGLLRRKASTSTVKQGNGSGNAVAWSPTATATSPTARPRCSTSRPRARR